MKVIFTLFAGLFLAYGNNSVATTIDTLMKNETDNNRTLLRAEIIALLDGISEDGISEISASDFHIHISDPDLIYDKNVLKYQNLLKYQNAPNYKIGSLNYKIGSLQHEIEQLKAQRDDLNDQIMTIGIDAVLSIDLTFVNRLNAQIALLEVQLERSCKTRDGLNEVDSKIERVCTGMGSGSDK